MSQINQLPHVHPASPALGSDSGAPPPALVELSRPECLRLLASHRIGRLAIGLADAAPVIRPVNYVFDAASQSVVFRTAAGSKLHALLSSGEAAFEIDSADESSRLGWSVIIRGVAEEITSAAEIRRVDRLGLEPWVPGPKPHWLRVRAWTVSGRRLVPGTS